MKLNYRRNNHDQLREQIRQQLGLPEPGTASAMNGQQPDEVLQWRTLNGALVMKRELHESEEPSVFWLSAELLAH